MKLKLKFAIIVLDSMFFTRNDLLTLINNKVAKLGVKHTNEYPEIILWQASNLTSSSVSSKINNTELTKQYVDIAKKFEDLGCTHLIILDILNNSQIQEIQKVINLKIINLLEELKATILNNFPEIKKIGIISTNKELNNKTFSKYIQGYLADLDVIYLDNEIQQNIDTHISKTSTPNNEIYNEIKQFFIEKEIYTILLYYIDIYKDNIIGNDINFIDIVDIIANSLIRIWILENNFSNDHTCAINQNNRIWGTNSAISTKKIKNIWDSRSQIVNKQKDQGQELLSVMVSNNISYVEQFNNYELSLITPLLKLYPESSSVLDIGCGMARWFINLKNNILKYTGIDGNHNYIKILNDRYSSNSNYKFYAFFVDEQTQLSDLPINIENKYSLVIINGLLTYFNDSITKKLFSWLNSLLEYNSQIYIRESVSIFNDRLTLQDYSSKEIGQDYCATYRTPKEYFDYLKKYILPYNFKISHSGFLHKDYTFLETNKKYFLLKRGV